MTTRDDYRAFADEHTINRFGGYVSELERMVAAQGWNLKAYYRSRWCAFKPSEHRNVAFGIGFSKENTLYLYIKRVYAEAQSFPTPMTAYNDGFDQVEYALEPAVTRLESFKSLLKLAYQRC